MKKGIEWPRFVPIHRDPVAPDILYELLEEREPHQSISHKEMPTREEHLKFLNNPKNYKVWYLIEDQGVYVGATYLTRQYEMGLFIFRRFKRRGYGRFAVKEMMRRWPGHHILANINPVNEDSASFFKKMGFRLIQHTYKLDNGSPN